MEFKHLTIKKILDVASYGNHGATRPVKVIANDGETWLLKTIYNNTLVAEGCCHVFAEILAYLIADYTKITPYLQEMALIEVTRNTILMAESALEQDDEANQEALSNLRKSMGTNFAVKWLDNADKPANLDRLPKSLVNATILTDAVLMNNDRTASNPNIIQSVSNRHLRVIDFGLGLNGLSLCQLALEANANVAFQHARTCTFESDYLFYHHLDKLSFPRKTPSRNDMINAMKNIPDQWASQSVKEAIAELIAYRFKNKEIIKEGRNASL
jgi:hypothetical protein